jgi:hypothetical protein
MLFLYRYRALLTSLLAIFSFVVKMGSQTSPGGVLTSATCKLWIDAGDINGDGDYTNNPAGGSAVTTWVDKSGNANNLTQATAASKPTYNTLAGTSVVRWDNTGAVVNYMTVTTPASLSPGSMFFVLRMLDAGDGANCLFDNNAANNTSIRYDQWNGTGLVGYTKYSVSDYTSTVASVFGSNIVLS